MGWGRSLGERGLIGVEWGGVGPKRERGLIRVEWGGVGPWGERGLIGVEWGGVGPKGERGLIGVEWSGVGPKGESSDWGRRGRERNSLPRLVPAHTSTRVLHELWDYMYTCAVVKTAWTDVKNSTIGFNVKF